MVNPDTKFAVIRINSKQFFIQKNNSLKLDRITEQTPVEVLLFQDDNLFIGEPILENFGVILEVLDNKKDNKVVTSRFKSKSRYRRNRSHRQPVSVVKVVDMGEGVTTRIKTKEK